MKKSEVLEMVKTLVEAGSEQNEAQAMVCKQAGLVDAITAGISPITDVELFATTLSKLTNSGGFGDFTPHWEHITGTDEKGEKVDYKRLRYAQSYKCKATEKAVEIIKALDISKLETKQIKLEDLLASSAGRQARRELKNGNLKTNV